FPLAGQPESPRLQRQILGEHAARLSNVPMEGEGKLCKDDRSFSEPTGNLSRSRSTTCLTPGRGIWCCGSPRRGSVVPTYIPGGVTRRTSLSHRRGELWGTRGPAWSTNWA